MSESDLNDEIFFWRKKFLGKAYSEHEKKIHMYFLSIPSKEMITKDISEIYKECVCAYLQSLESHI